MTGPGPRQGQLERPTTSPYRDLSTQVRAAGLLGRRLGYYWATFTALMLALMGLAAAALALGDSWWQLAVAALLGVLLSQFGFLGHDAAHQQVFASAVHTERAALSGPVLSPASATCGGEARACRSSRAPARSTSCSVRS